MNIFKGLENIVEKDYPLGQETWYELGGLTDFFVRPQTVNQLKEVVKRCKDNNIKIRTIGAGSNLLISDKGVRGVVIKLNADAFSQMEFKGQAVTAGAGVELSKLVLTCVQKGLSGIESLTGIPGSIGGAIKMNAGGNFGDIGAVVESVSLMDNEGGLFEKSKPELVFDYRTTNITANFILSAKLKLSPGDPDMIMKTIKEIWIYKKNNQPLSTKNAGCVFKNPRSVSAGAMIDRAGLKGTKIGGAIVSEKHANFIIAEKGCKSQDIIKLIEHVKKKVKEQFGIVLELEIEIWD